MGALLGLSLCVNALFYKFFTSGQKLYKVSIRKEFGNTSTFVSGFEVYSYRDIVYISTMDTTWYRWTNITIEHNNNEYVDIEEVTPKSVSWKR